MSGNINMSAYERFNAVFGKFVENAAVKDSTIAKIDTFSLNGVNSLKAGKGDFKGNLFRDAGQIATNNSVRDEFKKSVIAIFNGEKNIPASVKEAMKTADFDGKGRPLTARRIRATLAQIKTFVNPEKIRTALNSRDWLAETNLKVTDPTTRGHLQSCVNKLSDELCGTMKKLLLPDIRKGKAPSTEQMHATLKRFMVKSNEILAIESNIRTNIVNCKAGSDDKYEDDDRLFDKVCGAVWMRAFTLALAKNNELASFFFSANQTTDKAFENLNRAYADLRKESEEIDIDNDNTAEADKMAKTISHIFKDLSNTRAQYVFGLTRGEAVSELMRLTGDCFGKEIKKGKVSINDVITALSFSTDPSSKDILTAFFKKLADQVVAGTIRQSDTTKGTDYLYEQVLKEDIKRWMSFSARNGQRLMGSKEQDEAFLASLNTLLANNGYNLERLKGFDRGIFSANFNRGLI